MIKSILEKRGIKALEYLANQTEKPDLKQLLCFIVQYGTAKHLQDFLDKNNPAILNQRDSQGNTPLHYAAGCGNLQVLKVLIKAGADINIVDLQELLPIHHAISSGYKGIIKTLIKHDNSILDRGDNLSLIGYAVCVDRIDIVRFLILNNARVNFADNRVYFYLFRHIGEIINVTNMVEKAHLALKVAEGCNRFNYEATISLKKEALQTVQSIFEGMKKVIETIDNRRYDKNFAQTFQDYNTLEQFLSLEPKYIYSNFEDVNHLQVVWRNLLSNAIKVMSKPKRAQEIIFHDLIETIQAPCLGKLHGKATAKKCLQEFLKPEEQINLYISKFTSDSHDIKVIVGDNHE